MKTKIMIGAAIFASFLLMAAGADAEMTRSTAERLMASGKSLACEYKSASKEADHEGTIYISRGKMRGDYKISDPSSGTYDGHMIQDGSGWAYMWGGPLGQGRGTKMKVDGSSNGGGRNPEGFDMRQELDLDCREWSADASKFEVPSDIEFMDLSQMMGGAYAAMASSGAGVAPGGETQTDSMQAMKCQICEQIPDEESRGQCRQMMGC